CACPTSASPSAASASRPRSGSTTDCGGRSTGTASTGPRAPDVKVLVTGASGFVGRNLVSALPASWDVTAVWHRSDDFPGFLSARGLSHVRPVRVDFATADAAQVAAVLGDAYDGAVCLAANGDPARSVAEPRMDLAANALSLVTLLERVRVGHLVFVSSGAVYDGVRGEVHPGVAVAPRLPYAISKL